VIFAPQTQNSAPLKETFPFRSTIRPAAMMAAEESIDRRPRVGSRSIFACLRRPIRTTAEQRGGAIPAVARFLKACFRAIHHVVICGVVASAGDEVMCE
jgi:hypothetical protein